MVLNGIDDRANHAGGILRKQYEFTSLITRILFLGNPHLHKTGEHRAQPVRVDLNVAVQEHNDGALDGVNSSKTAADQTCDNV